MSGTCKDCMYWEEGGTVDYTTLVGMGACTKAVFLQWEMVEEVEVSEPYQCFVHKLPTTNGNMFVRDGENYHADFITTPDFGCINFKLKEEV